MRRFAVPALSVIAGMAFSWSLQAAGVAPTWAKLAGVAAVFAVLAGWWLRAARS